MLEISSKEGSWEGIDVFAINDNIIHALSPALLPVLTTVAVQGCKYLTDAGLLSYIKARAEGGAPLQRVDIAFDRPMEEDILSDLSGFISDGLKVSLKYTSEKSERQHRYCPWELTDVVD
ncbi:hypothetical protein B0H19DRAFT_1259591 [Mycena capillaripes]|nr:hypothetical protein B0H19DRAFT_1259591 [Mycena capillaripes]